YTAYENVTRNRQVPYTEYDYQCDSQNNCRNVPVTRYRTDYYEETVPVTRYRDVPHSQAYDGYNRYQLLALSVNGETNYAVTKKPISFADRSEKSGFEHDWNMPDIGLHPQSAGLPDPLDWLKEEVGNLGRTWGAQATDTWQDFN